MKKFLVLLLCMSSLYVFSQSVNSYDINNKKDGYWEVKYKNGNYKYQGNFNNGVPVGKLKRFYDTGILKADMYFSDNGTKAKCILYDNKGVRSAEGKYVNSQKDSIWLIYNAKKSIKAMESYKKDKLDGESQYFFDNGNKSFIINYTEGEKNGLYERFFENGNHFTQVNYKNGKLHGFYYSFYSNGKLEVSGSFNENIRYGKWTYLNLNGSLKKQVVYDENGNADNQSELDLEEQKELRRLESNKNKFKEPVIGGMRY